MWMCVCVCARKRRTGAECRGAGVVQTLQPAREREAGHDLCWSRHRRWERPEPGERLCPESVQRGEPLRVSRLGNAPQKASFLEYFLISWIPREG